MKVGVYPNEESARIALVSESFDILIVTSFEGCCHTAILVPNGPYSDMFEDLYGEYIPNHAPISYDQYIRNKPLDEVTEEISRAIAEATFVDLRVQA